jgi:hypothetical protein
MANIHQLSLVCLVHHDATVTDTQSSEVQDHTVRGLHVSLDVLVVKPDTEVLHLLTDMYVLGGGGGGGFFFLSVFSLANSTQRPGNCVVQQQCEGVFIQRHL